MLRLIAALVAAGGLTASQTSRPAQAETPHLVLTTSASVTAAAPGSRVSLFVDITPKPKMHVYSPEQKDVIPISLKLDAGDFKPHPIVLPKPEKYFFEPLNETQLVFSKPFRIVQPVTLGSHVAGPTTVDIKGSVRYQACDDTICYVPVTVPVGWQVEIKKAR